MTVMVHYLAVPYHQVWLLCIKNTVKTLLSLQYSNESRIFEDICERENWSSSYRHDFLRFNKDETDQRHYGKFFNFWKYFTPLLIIDLQVYYFFRKPAKGHLISEWLFDVLNFPKTNAKIWWISALESKKWLNTFKQRHHIMVNNP